MEIDLDLKMEVEVGLFEAKAIEVVTEGLAKYYYLGKVKVKVFQSDPRRSKMYENSCSMRLREIMNKVR